MTLVSHIRQMSLQPKDRWSHQDNTGCPHTAHHLGSSLRPPQNNDLKVVVLVSELATVEQVLARVEQVLARVERVVLEERGQCCPKPMPHTASCMLHPMH